MGDYDDQGVPFFTGAEVYDRTEDEREEGETFGLMTRVNGRGRLIPTPALSKIMLHLVAGGLGGPLLKTVHCIVKSNEPVTVTVTVTMNQK